MRTCNFFFCLSSSARKKSHLSHTYIHTSCARCNLRPTAAHIYRHWAETKKAETQIKFIHGRLSLKMRFFPAKRRRRRDIKLFSSRSSELVCAVRWAQRQFGCLVCAPHRQAEIPATVFLIKFWFTTSRKKSPTGPSGMLRGAFNNSKDANSNETNICRARQVNCRFDFKIEASVAGAFAKSSRKVPISRRWILRRLSGFFLIENIIFIGKDKI